MEGNRKDHAINCAGINSFSYGKKKRIELKDVNKKQNLKILEEIIGEFLHKLQTRKNFFLTGQKSEDPKGKD